MACLKKPLLNSSELQRTLQHTLFRPRTHILTVPFFLLSLFLLSVSYTTYSTRYSYTSTIPSLRFPLSFKRVLANAPFTSYIVSEAQSNTFSSVTAAERTPGNPTKTDSQDLNSCDIFDGSWIQDDSHEPVYQHGSCPFLDDTFNCFKNGRSDFEFLKYRWKPHGCQIPRFYSFYLVKFHVPMYQFILIYLCFKFDFFLLQYIGLMA